MSEFTTGLVIVLGLFAGILFFIELGIRLGMWRLAHCPEGARAGVGAVEGAIFGLMGLLIAFTFSGAASRFDGRRQLILDEANAIGTAWLRLDMLPAQIQPDLRTRFREYLDSRINEFRSIPDWEASNRHRARADALQAEIWSLATAACKSETGQPVTMLVLPALNAMFDSAASRNMARTLHPPPIIYWMVTTLALLCSLLVGVAMASGKARSWVHVTVFAAIMAMTVYVIIDLEHPRMGLIRVTQSDQVLLELRQSME